MSAFRVCVLVCECTCMCVWVCISMCVCARVLCVMLVFGLRQTATGRGMDSSWTRAMCTHWHAIYAIYYKEMRERKRGCGSEACLLTCSISACGVCTKYETFPLGEDCKHSWPSVATGLYMKTMAFDSLPSYSTWAKETERERKREREKNMSKRIRHGFFNKSSGVIFELRAELWRGKARRIVSGHACNLLLFLL